MNNKLLNIYYPRKYINIIELGQFKKLFETYKSNIFENLSHKEFNLKIYISWT